MSRHETHLLVHLSMNVPSILWADSDCACAHCCDSVVSASVMHVAVHVKTNQNQGCFTYVARSVLLAWRTPAVQRGRVILME